ncbi:MAG: hypothetical protein K2I03_09850 [Lachnospiraceae bacterium]|nr:hypothetical protein [Lachnospiraceae bacterium]
MNTDLKLFQSFFLENILILNIENSENSILIKLHSKTKSAICPYCKKESSGLHATHHRKIQDLHVYGKQTWLDIILLEYNCDNPDCKAVTFTETYNGFFNNYCRMTDRLVQLVVSLAIETSCESCARILNSLKVKISGDTVIRTILKYYYRQPKPECGDVIGIDDFALKKDIHTAL